MFIPERQTVKTVYRAGESILRTLRRVYSEKAFNETHEDMRMKVTYRTDPATLRKFHREILTKCFHEEDMEDAYDFLDGVRSGDYVVVLVEENKEILGGIVIEHSWSTGKKIMLIAWVAVKEKHRGRNIGTFLIEEALSYAKSQGALILLGEVENPEMFEEEDPAYGNPVKRARFYSRFDCKRLEVPYVVPSYFGVDGLERE